MKIRVEIQGSPRGFDVAFSSVDFAGSPGRLNQFVIRELGFDEKGHLPGIDQLQSGVVQITSPENKCKVIYVVTVGNENTSVLLERNFNNAMLGFAKNWKDQRVWIPLLGVGDGMLDFEESFDIIFGNINRHIKQESAPDEIVFSIPEEAGEKGLKIIKAKISRRNGPEIKDGPDVGDQKFDEGLSQDDGVKYDSNIFSNRKLFVAGHKWKSGDQFNRFIGEGIWENGHEKNDVEAVNSVEDGDIVFLKSTFAKGKTSYLRLKAFGVVVHNMKDGHNLLINWTVISGFIDIEQLGKYRRTFQRIMPDDIDLVLRRVIFNLPDFPREVAKLIQSATRFDEEFSGSLPEVAIDDKMTLYYGQKLGVELLNYDIFFLPKSAIGGVGRNGISDPILKILDLPRETLSFDEPILENKKFVWFRFNNVKKKRAAYLCFIVSRDREKNYYEFGDSFLPALDEFKTKYPEQSLERLNIFIPLIGAGQAGIDAESSLIQVLKGVRLFRTYFIAPKVRINLPISYSGQELENLINIIIVDLSVRPYKENNQGGGGKKPPGKDGNGTIGGNSDGDNGGDDKIPFHLDQVVADDELGRKPVAIAFANLINKDVFSQDINSSFMVHLHGDWGSGKSSFLNFIEQALNKGEEKWVVIRYNAWQNQHIRPPWWTLLDHIYRKGKESSFLRNEGAWRVEIHDNNKLWWKEKIRRVIKYSSWKKLFHLLLTIFFVGILYRFGNSIMEYVVNNTNTTVVDGNPVKGLYLDVFIKLIVSIGAGLGVLYTLSKFISTPFFIKTAEEATSFVSRAKDPMHQIKDHFNKLVDDLLSDRYNNKRRLAIFIDDIDRCNREFIVDLLEGIQTLFKDKKVLYIVSGERKWVTTSFGNQYKEFVEDQNNFVLKNELGEKFLEKAFQLSFRMPGISEEAKQKYWKENILGRTDDEEENTITDEEDIDQETTNQIQFELEQAGDEIYTPEFKADFAAAHNLSNDVASNIIIEKLNTSNEDVRHLLQRFDNFIDTNPRSIIRLANTYTMARSTLLAEDKRFSIEKLFRWLLIDSMVPELEEVVTKMDDLEEAIQSIKSRVQQGEFERINELISGEHDELEEGELKHDEIKTFIGL